MAIKVGINENVQLKSAELNEKGTLVVKFTQGDIAQVSTDDLLNSAAGIKAGGETNVMIWGIRTEDAGNARDKEHISRDVASMRDQLEHILLGYMTKENATLNPYDGTGLTKDNFDSLITKQATVDKMYNNLATQFINKVNTLGEALQGKFRLLLIRKSAANHYGTFRRNFITDNPFFESMLIPKEASAVKFTKYEITKGLNSAEAVAKPAAEAATVAQSTSDDILGTR